MYCIYYLNGNHFDLLGSKDSFHETFNTALDAILDDTENILIVRNREGETESVICCVRDEDPILGIASGIVVRVDYPGLNFPPIRYQVWYEKDQTGKIVTKFEEMKNEEHP